MLGWWKLSRMLISRMEVSGKPSWCLSILIFFSAHMVPFSLSRALQVNVRIH